MLRVLCVRLRLWVCTALRPLFPSACCRRPPRQTRSSGLSVQQLILRVRGVPNNTGGRRWYPPESPWQYPSVATGASRLARVSQSRALSTWALASSTLTTGCVRALCVSVRVGRRV